MTTVAMVAPEGVTTFIALSGVVYEVDSDGEIDIPSNDVPGAIAAGFLPPASGNLDGATISNSTIGDDAADTIGFYGATKVAQPSGASQAAYTPSTLTAIASTTFSQAFTGMWAFASSTVAKSYRTQINKLITDVPKISTLILELRANLVTLGLVKGSA